MIKEYGQGYAECLIDEIVTYKFINKRQDKIEAITKILSLISDLNAMCKKEIRELI